MERTLSIVQTSLWPLLTALLQVTIPLTILSFSFGLIIAVITALARISKQRILNTIFYLYVWIFRGTPLLVQLFIVFFGLPSVGIQFEAFPAAVLTLSLNTGAYASETIRSALLAIPNGQYESAASLGMSRWQILRRILAPQAFKIAVPPLSNTLISLVKDTSLASSITIVEIFMTGQRIAARTYEPLLLYCLVAVYYLMVCTVLGYFQQRLEQRMARY
ncbi:amino acid ABC transporter permease [Enterococcus sp. 669A]|uniref:Amino acid ABC transporter permease n=1 Tax=Candidatus Enterococcus moelleringii TaxID=2815325 RepID=A0ABS3LEA1_9ENTE|nr:amino acid ABC transporter permease [Enterococcus sp. 669A]MBO1307967.1 amino acid ABC transporter permease [Enterococcus sp. 669A]